MALKKSNYYVKSLGMTLPQAVALITTCKSDRENGTATIGVFASRENALNKDIQPFETVTVGFKVDRTENDRATAYHTAKTPKSYEWVNANGEKRFETIHAPFEGWEDDIV